MSHPNLSDRTKSEMNHESVDDYTSSSGSSTEEEMTDNDNDDDENIVTDNDKAEGGSKHDSKTRNTSNDTKGQSKLKTQMPLPNDNLKSRLANFLLRMERANKELEDAGDVLAHRVDDVGDHEENYIEMNLSLGVLTERDDANDIRTEDPEHAESDIEDNLRICSTEAASKTKAAKHKIEEL